MLIFRIAAVIVTLAGVTGPVAERAPVACLVYTPAGSSQPCSAAAFADALNRSLIYAQGAGYPSSYSFASWWYTDSPVAGDSPLTAFDVFGNGVGNMSGWAGGTRITLVRKTATAPQLNAATNALIEQNAQVDPAVNHCGNIPQNRAFDWFVGNMSSQQLTNFTSAFWPAYSIDIERADAAAGVLIVSLSAPPRGDMHMWSAQSTINQYCWAVRPNPYTTVGNDGAALVYLEQQLAGALGSAAPNSTDISGGVFDTSSLIAYRGGVSSWFVVVVVAAFLLLSGLVFPDAPTRIVAEREKGLEFLVRLAGVDWAGLWLGNVAFDLAIVASWSVAFTVVGLLVSSSALKFLSVGHLVLLLLAWSVAQVAMGYLFSAALASEVSASILAHLFVVVGAGLGAAVYYFSAWHPAMFLVPHFAFAHGMAALFGFTDSDDDVFVAVGALLGVGLPLLLAAVALNNPAEARAALQRCRKGRTKAAVAWPRRGARAESVSTPLLNDEEAGNTQQHAPVALSRSYGSVNSDSGEEGGGGGGEARAVLIERVSFLYPASERAPAKLALDSLSLEADYGECVGVLGPSGAGKTTLLDLMCGRLSATEGRVLVGGLDMASRPPGAALRIGFVPQRTVLFDELSTREQLATFARLRGVASAEACSSMATRSTAARATSPKACGGDSPSASPSSAGRACCSATSPRPRSRPTRAAKSGPCSTRSNARAAPSSSARMPWTRQRRSAHASPSLTRAASAPSAPSPLSSSDSAGRSSSLSPSHALRSRHPSTHSQTQFAASYTPRRAFTPAANRLRCSRSPSSSRERLWRRSRASCRRASSSPSSLACSSGVSRRPRCGMCSSPQCRIRAREPTARLGVCGARSCARLLTNGRACQ
jgi:hypothetical protein